MSTTETEAGAGAAEAENGAGGAGPIEVGVTAGITEVAAGATVVASKTAESQRHSSFDATQDHDLDSSASGGIIASLPRQAEAKGPNGSGGVSRNEKPLRQHVKFRYQLILVFGSLVIISIVLSSVAGYFLARREIHQEVDNFLKSSAEEIVRSAEQYGSEALFFQALQIEQARAILGALDAPAPIVVRYETWAQIRTAQGVLWHLHSSEMPRLEADIQIARGEIPAQFSTRQFTPAGQEYSTRLRIYSFQIADHVSMQLGRDLRETESALDDLFYRTFFIGLAVTAVMAFLGWLFGRRIMKPVEQLAVRTDRIAQTQDLSTPVEVQGGGEVAQLAQSFNRMLVALDLSRQQQQQFVADAGHELRTPLTSLRVNIDLLASDIITEPDEKAKLLDDMQKEIMEFSKIVEELVELSADPHRAEELVMVDLADVAQHIADRAMGQTHTEVEVKVIDSVETLGNFRALERAVRNLVENAIKFGPDDAPVEITVSGTKLEVRDFGPGIGEDQKDKIFDRFYRSIEAQTKPGSGLGLAITKQVVERHGGQVSARNHPEGGAVIGFSLPHRTG